MGYDWVFKGGLVLCPDGLDRLDIGIKDGKIAELDVELNVEGTKGVIQASGKYLFPGLIDVHVHPVYVDSIRDCSILGAFGGITTMIHYAYARPGMGLAETVRRCVQEGTETSLTDFGVHGAMFDPGKQISEIPECFEFGVRSFKMFMTYAKLGWMTDDYHLAKAMDAIGKLGGLAMVHAEDGLSIDYLEDKFRDRPQKEVFLKVRPSALEADATYRAMAVAEVMNCPLYIVHVTAGRALELIRTARERQGLAVFAETCPQYLCLTDQILREKGPLAKIGPPLRTRQDNEALWRGLRDGWIDVVASDHAPKTKRPDDDFFEAPFGSPSSETMLEVCYQRGVNEGRVDLPTLVKAMSETPAKIFGLFPKKGAILKNADADLVLFDPARKHVITQGTQHSNAPYTLYEGWKCLGAPTLVMQKGRILVEYGRLKSAQPSGEFLPVRLSHERVH